MVFVIGALFAACGTDRASDSSDATTTTTTTTVASTTTTTPPTTTTSATTSATTTAASTTPTTSAQSFDDRPYDVFVPSSYNSATAAPLVILLHGYGVTGALQEILFRLQPQAEERGFLYVYPDASLNRIGDSSWNATDACCNDSDVDDTAYLNHIIDEVSATYNVDPTRIFLAGHSNGGFMAYRMACDHADRIAAIVSLAGATFLDAERCAPSEPVSILQIHGTDDGTIEYDGGFTPIGPYPSAAATVAAWATYNGCTDTNESLGAIDLGILLAGAETTRQAFTGCPVDGAVELWTMNDGPHIPLPTANFAADLVDWLFAHPKAQ